MYDPNTLRVLSIDGGGFRGYFTLHWLRKFIIQIGEDPSDRTVCSRLFDVITGTSVGAIIALALAAEKMSVDELIEFFEEHGPYIFSLTSLSPSWRPNEAAKIALFIAGVPFYQSSGPTENAYGAGLLKTLVQEQFGASTMQDVQTNVLIPSYQQDTNTFVLFSNANLVGLTGQSYLLSDVALATSAAPVYLPAWTFGGHTYIDGGVYQNNPSSLGVSLGKSLRPIVSRVCLLSLGTGMGEIGFDESGHAGPPSFLLSKRKKSFHSSGVTFDELKSTPAYDLLLKINPQADLESLMLVNPVEALYSLFEIAYTGAQESVAKSFDILSSYSLEPFYTYRFNAVLDPGQNTELDSSDSDTRTYYEDLAETLFNSDITKISNFIGHFTA